MTVQPSNEKQKLKSVINEAREWNNRTKALDNSSAKSRSFSWLKKIIIRISRLFMTPQAEVNERVLDCLSLLTEKMVRSESEDFQKSNSIDLEIGAIYERVLDRQPSSVEVSYWKEYIDRDNVSLSQVEFELTITPEYISRTLIKCKTSVDLPNFRIYAMRSDIAVAHEIITHKRWENHVTDAFIKTLKEGDVFLDLGANIGYYTLLAASIVKESGKSIAFEPNYINVQLILSGADENNFNNVVVYPLAASDTNTIMEMGTGGSNGQIKDASQPLGQIWIQSVLVDQVLGLEKKINVIKMDVEHHEPFALRGMDKIVRKHRPIIFTEFHPASLGQEYLDQLTQYGYSLSIIDHRPENAGEIVEAQSTNFIMDFWGQLNSPIQHLDILARPQ